MSTTRKSFTEYIQESIRKAGVLMTEMAEDIAKDVEQQNTKSVYISLHLKPEDTEPVLTVSTDYPVL